MAEMFDVTIVGGGTTGLYAAFYSGMRGLKTKVMEYQPDVGGKVSFFYPEKKIYDVGGFPGVTGENLVANVQAQAESVKPKIVTGVKVTSIDALSDGTYVLKEEGGGEHYSRTILIAAGMGTFEMQPLQVPGAEKYADTCIHYTIQHLVRYAGKSVAVVSENRVGVDWALALENCAEEVHLINAGDKFKAVYEGDVEKLEASSIHVHYHQSLERLHGEDKLSHITLRDGEKIKVDHLLVYEGLQIDKSLYEQWGITTEKGRIPVGTDMCTNREGIYVAGDAAIYPNKTMLIASGFNEAMAAVNSAAIYLDPKAKSQVYSTVIYKHTQ
ncbi:NAD(P)/FAD-dependent oxidoreductase [Halobacillus sp. KGW1]|uniref:NAD(P)/FAD-dependent oxidoreductase n=1 Tax=Halobacillus sp. KGW1 TaxID=1793726 RepID=UPI0007849D3E|nr:NAD(P)/FAD-dependent oxidoreductase [Halobacillus sp. KGW1]